MTSLFKKEGYLLCVMCLFALFLVGIPGCNNNDDLSQYTFPANYTPTTYVVEQEETGNTGYTYVYEVNGLTDEEKQEIFESQRQREEAADKYEVLTNVWNEPTFEQEEEERIEKYCNDNGFYSCYDIKYTCESEYTCHKVYITCEDEDFDPGKLSYQHYDEDKDDECREYKVKVDEDTFDISRVDDSDLEDAGYQWE